MSSKNGWLWKVGISSAMGPQAMMGAPQAASPAQAEIPAPAYAETPAEQNEFRGNVKSKAFHQPGCRFYDGADCTTSFASRDEAQEAGYKPCKVCKP